MSAVTRADRVALLMRRDIVAGGLLERDEQLGQVRAAIDAARRGAGCVLVVSGPAGVGKTSLLRAATEQARDRGVAVLSARADELERELGHGVTRQLLDRVVAELGDDERAALLSGAAALAAPVLGLPAAPAPPSTDPEFAARHGLTWLVAGLAERRPLVLALDDVQWADAPALRWLAYLAQRVDELAVVVLLARRSGEASSDDAAFEALCRGAREIELAPLSRAAVAELVHARTGLTPAEDLVEECLAASGGNPFLLDATLSVLDEEGTPSLRRPLAGARRVGPAILRRLARLPADATALARAVAVLGEGAELAAAAQLAELALERAAAAADALVVADLFAAGERLGFAHGLVRDAVAADVGTHALRAAHAQAARVLRAFGAPVDRIASQLLMAAPARDPLAAADLREAARRSLAQGAPTTAVTLLRRALDEPPPPEELGGVLMELGMAELVSGIPAGSNRLSAAIEALDDPAAQTAAAQAQTMALIAQHRVDVAALTIERVRPRVAAQPAQLMTLDACSWPCPWPTSAAIRIASGRSLGCARRCRPLNRGRRERAARRSSCAPRTRSKVSRRRSCAPASTRRGARARCWTRWDRRTSSACTAWWRCASRAISPRWTPSPRRSPTAPSPTARSSASATRGCGGRSRARAWGA